MLEAHSRSGRTEIGWTMRDRTCNWVTIKKTGKGQSPQCFRKKNTKGRQASKNASQLEPTTAPELANAFSSGICHSCGNGIRYARNFFLHRAFACDGGSFLVCLRPPKKRGRTGFD